MLYYSPLLSNSVFTACLNLCETALSLYRQIPSMKTCQPTDAHLISEQLLFRFEHVDQLLLQQLRLALGVTAPPVVFLWSGQSRHPSRMTSATQGKNAQKSKCMHGTFSQASLAFIKAVCRRSGSTLLWTKFAHEQYTKTGTSSGLVVAKKRVCSVIWPWKPVINQTQIRRKYSCISDMFSQPTWEWICHSILEQF